MQAAHRLNGAAVAREGPSRRYLDWWTVFLLVVPIIGTFFPPETYFGVSDGTYDLQQIKVPITPVLLIVICLSVALMYLDLSRRQRVRHDPLAYLLILWVLASVFWSFDPQLSFQRALRILPLILLAVLFAQTHSINRMLRLMALAFLISACASIVVGAAIPSLGLSRMVGSYESAWRGALLHKNTTGFTYALGVMVAIFAWRAGAIGYRLAIAVLFTCILMVIMAQSATSMLAALVALVPCAVLILVDRAPLGLRVLVTVIMLMVIVLGVSLLSFAGEIFAAFGRDVTLTGRTDIWAVVWSYIVDRPLTGYGYGFWGADSPVRDGIWRDLGLPTPHAHNSWLDLAIQIGFVGAGLVFLLLTIGLKRAVSAQVIQRRAEAPLLLSIIIILLIRSMTEVEFSEPSAVGLFWLTWAGLSVRRDVTQPAPEGSTASMPRVARTGHRLSDQKVEA